MSKISEYVKDHAKVFFYSIVIAVIVALGFIIFRQHETITLTKTQVKSLTDTVTITRNKLGQEVAKRQTIAGDLRTTQAQLTIAKADKELINLSSDKKNISGIVISNTTKEDTTVKITHSTIDTANSDDKPDTPKITPVLAKIYENFAKDITTEWYTETITKKDDSLSISLKVKNKYVSSISKDGDKYVLTVKNLNPHTETNDIQSYYITPPPPKNGKYFLIGTGVGAVAIIAILHFLGK